MYKSYKKQKKRKKKEGACTPADHGKKPLIRDAGSRQGKSENLSPNAAAIPIEAPRASPLSARHAQLERLRAAIDAMDLGAHAPVLPGSVHDAGDTSSGSEAEDSGDSDELSAPNEPANFNAGSHAGAARRPDRSNPSTREIDPKMFDNMPWEVECTKRVWDALLDRRRPLKLRILVAKKIQHLAKGEWNPQQDAKRTQGSSKLKGVPLFEARFSKAGRILWQRAVAFSPRRSLADKGRAGRIYSEVIRIWAVVFDHDRLGAEIDASVDRAVVALRQTNTEMQAAIGHAERAVAKGTTASFKVELSCEFEQAPVGRSVARVQYPNVFQLGSSSTSKTTTLTPAANPDPQSYTVEKLYSFSSHLVEALLNNLPARAVDFPFQVTDAEDLIIRRELNPARPLLLLGRSGTGKTTCLLYRLFRRHHAYWEQASENGGPLMPLNGDCASNRTAGSPSAGTPAEIDHSNPEGTEAAAATTNSGAAEASVVSSVEYEHLHTVFITKNRVLLSEVKKRFKQCARASQYSSAALALGTKRMTLQKYVDAEEAGSSPFPLFYSGEDWLLLLDATFGGPTYAECFFSRDPITGEVLDKVHIGPEKNHEQSDSDARGFTGRNRRRVDFDLFSSVIFPMMNKGFEFEFEPMFVWIEINSYIKGSVEALESLDGYTTLAQYEDFGRKRAPNFRSERKEVYSLFKSYQRVLKTEGYFDGNDLVRHIYRRAKKVPVPCSIHQLYVDEVQDFTMAELALLVLVSSEPNQIFLAGDTAQCINRGIGFRFEELRSLFYFFSSEVRAKASNTISFSNPSRWSAPVRIPDKPDVLEHNYRSHVGVMQLAASTLDVLEKYFPETFDTLERDESMFPGPLPTLFTVCNFVELAMLMSDSKRDDAVIDFGATQVIIVPNEEAKAALPDELNRMNICLTLEEAKGLEFEDVLMLNFFSKSRCAPAEWRVISGYLEDHLEGSAIPENAVEIPGHVRCRPLEFNSTRHKVLSSELKYLYTAITRARSNLWIVDLDSAARGPMFEYWATLGLVEVVASSEGGSGAIYSRGSESTPEDWRKQGDYFASHEIYEPAAQCYEKAGDLKLQHATLARARAEQSSKPGKSPKERQDLQLEAAESYLQCAEHAKAAEALTRAEEPALAAAAYGKLGMVVDAAKANKRAKQFRLAAEQYRTEGMHQQSMDCLLLGKHFREACRLAASFEARPTATKSGLGAIYSLAHVVNKAARQAHDRHDFHALEEILSKYMQPAEAFDFCRENALIQLGADQLRRRKDGSALATEYLRQAGFAAEARASSQDLPAALIVKLLISEIRTATIAAKYARHASNPVLTAAVDDAKLILQKNGAKMEAVERSELQLAIASASLHTASTVPDDLAASMKAAIASLGSRRPCRRARALALLLHAPTQFDSAGRANRDIVLETMPVVMQVVSDLLLYVRAVEQGRGSTRPKNVSDAFESFGFIAPASGEESNGKTVKGFLWTGNEFIASFFEQEFLSKFMGSKSSAGISSRYHQDIGKIALRPLQNLVPPTWMKPGSVHAEVDSSDHNKFSVNSQHAAILIADSLLGHVADWVDTCNFGRPRAGHNHAGLLLQTVSGKFLEVHTMSIADRLDAVAVSDALSKLDMSLFQPKDRYQRYSLSNAENFKSVLGEGSKAYNLAIPRPALAAEESGAVPVLKYAIRCPSELYPDCQIIWAIWTSVWASGVEVGSLSKLSRMACELKAMLGKPLYRQARVRLEEWLDDYWERQFALSFKLGNAAGSKPWPSKEVFDANARYNLADALIYYDFKQIVGQRPRGTNVQALDIIYEKLNRLASKKDLKFEATVLNVFGDRADRRTKHIGCPLQAWINAAYYIRVKGDEFNPLHALLEYRDLVQMLSQAYTAGKLTSDWPLQGFEVARVIGHCVAIAIFTLALPLTLNDDLADTLSTTCVNSCIDVDDSEVLGASAATSTESIIRRMNEWALSGKPKRIYDDALDTSRKVLQMVCENADVLLPSPGKLVLVRHIMCCLVLNRRRFNARAGPIGDIINRLTKTASNGSLALTMQQMLGEHSVVRLGRAKGRIVATVCPNKDWIDEMSREYKAVEEPEPAPVSRRRSAEGSTSHLAAVTPGAASYASHASRREEKHRRLMANWRRLGVVAWPVAVIVNRLREIRAERVEKEQHDRGDQDSLGRPMSECVESLLLTIEPGIDLDACMICKCQYGETQSRAPTKAAGLVVPAEAHSTGTPRAAQQAPAQPMSYQPPLQPDDFPQQYSHAYTTALVDFSALNSAGAGLGYGFNVQSGFGFAPMAPSQPQHPWGTYQTPGHPVYTPQFVAGQADQRHSATGGEVPSSLSANAPAFIPAASARDTARKEHLADPEHEKKVGEYRMYVQVITASVIPLERETLSALLELETERLGKIRSKLEQVNVKKDKEYTQTLQEHEEAARDLTARTRKELEAISRYYKAMAQMRDWAQASNQKPVELLQRSRDHVKKMIVDIDAALHREVQASDTGFGDFWVAENQRKEKDRRARPMKFAGSGGSKHVSGKRKGGHGAAR